MDRKWPEFSGVIRIQYTTVRRNGPMLHSIRAFFAGYYTILPSGHLDAVYSLIQTFASARLSLPKILT